MGRFDYVRYDEQAQKAQDAFKEMFSQLTMNVEAMDKGRAQSLALTKLEEAYMWVGKALRDEQIARNGSAPLMEERKDG